MISEYHLMMNQHFNKANLNSKIICFAFSDSYFETVAY